MLKKVISHLARNIVIGVLVLTSLCFGSGNANPLQALSPAVTPAPPENWLDAVNYYRAIANLPPVSENATYSDGDWKHARYMVKNDYLGHTEDPANPWYTPEGQAAAEASNVRISGNIQTTDLDAINGWMEGPFHAVGILDPALHQTGFGSYREAIGQYHHAAALDVIRGLGAIDPAITFPVYFPGDGSFMPLLRYPGQENPDPLTSCPGYTVPTGSGIILQIGDGSRTPNVTATGFWEDGVAREHCTFNETNYVNPDSAMQSLGRNVLNSRDAIVIIPRSPLKPQRNYTVSVTVNGLTYTWSFTAMGSRVYLPVIVRQ